MSDGAPVVLVLDDNAFARRLAVLMLRELGYEAIGAATAARALAEVESGRRIDLLFADLVLPGDMNGADVAREAVKLRPGLAVLYASGYTGRGVVATGLLTEDAPFLAKPFRKAALAESVARALAGEGMDGAG